ncbi:MAG TPA: hypothetical protein VLK29_00345 [Luteimonas sp.]|nr:hypothetical protein [Luteimonas sp.]
MNTTTAQRATVLAALAVLMAMTRIHHFGAIPDASWAVFFVAGFYLREWTRWALPALMALAVVIDVLVVSAQGVSFWQHYCVSPAYWCLAPAHALLWGGGAWLRSRYRAAAWRELGLLAIALPVSVAACHLVAQGSFYWISASVAEPSMAGWWQNYTDWLPPYLRVATLYVAAATAAHLVAARSGVPASPTVRAR